MLCAHVSKFNSDLPERLEPLPNPIAHRIMPRATWRKRGVIEPVSKSYDTEPVYEALSAE